MSCFVDFVRAGGDSMAMKHADDSLKKLLQPLANTPDAQESAAILMGFQKMVFNANGSSAFTVLKSAGQMTETMDEFVQLYTDGIYRNVETLIKEAPINKTAMSLLRVVGRKSIDMLDKFAAYRTDFGSAQEDSKYADFFRVYNNFLTSHSITNGAARVLGGEMMRDHALMIANKGPLEARDPELFGLSKQFIGINSSIKTFNNELHDVIDNLYKSHNISGYLDDTMINDFVSKTSGVDYVKSKALATELAKERLDDGYIKNPTGVDDATVVNMVANNLVSFKKSFDMINYGYDVEKLDNDTKAMNPDEKNAYRRKMLSDINNLKMIATKEGTEIPPLFWMITQVGGQLSDVIKRKMDNKMQLEEIEQRFYNVFNKENGTFTAMTYYVPSEVEDMLGIGNLSGRSEKLTHMPSFSKHRLGTTTEGVADLHVKLADNMKSYQNTIEKLSKYSILSLENKIIEDRFESNLVPDEMKNGMNIIHSENKIQLDKLEELSLDKQYQKQIVIAKQAAGAYVSLVAGGLLMASGVNNILGGGIGIISALGFKDAYHIIKNYHTAPKSSDQVSREVRRMIDFRLSYIDPISTKSDMILQAVKDDSRLIAGFDMATNFANKAGDWMLSKGILGYIPIFKELAFNRSEDNLSKIQNAILYDRTNTYIQSAVEHSKIPLYEIVNGVSKPTKEFQGVFNRAMELFENDARQKAYEAIGRFDSQAKPTAFNMLKNAETVGGVVLGTMGLTMSMFKQVEHVNGALLNKQLSILLQKDAFNPTVLRANLQSMNNPANASGIFAVGLLSFYEWMADEYNWLPQAYGAYNANPTQLPKNAWNAAWALHSVFSGDPIDPKEAEGLLNMVRFTGGTGLSGAASKMAMDTWLSEHPLTPYFKKYARACNIDNNYYQLLARSVVPFDKASEMFQYRTELNSLRTEFFPSENHPMNVASYPFISTVPIIGSNNKVTKIINDIAMTINSSLNTFTLPEKSRDLAWSNVRKDLTSLTKDVIGLSVFIPNDVVEKQKYFDYSQEYRLRRLEWGRNFHGYEQSANYLSYARANHSRMIRITSKNDYRLMHPEYNLDRIPPKPYTSRKR